MSLPTMILALFMTLVATPTAWAADSVDALVTEAIEANPELAARRATVEALRALAGVAGTWPDPVVGIEYSNVPVTSFALGDHAMAGLQFRAQQTVRPPTWSRLQREVGDALAEGEEHSLAEAEVQLGVTVEQTYWRLALSRLLGDITEAHLARTEELLQAVVARYEVGRAGQHAVLRLGVLRDRLQDDLHDFERADRELSAALARALSREEATFATPTEFTALDPPADASGWVDLALAHRPELARIRADVHGSEAAADLARADGLPDVSFWVGYRVRTITSRTDPGTDLASAGLSVPIPLGSGRRARGQRAAYLLSAEAAEARHAATVDRIEADLTFVLARWQRAHHKAATYDSELLPAARSTLDTTLADYRVDKADFSSLYDGEIALLDLERARLAAAVETYIQRAEARAVLGTTPPGGVR
ncbi:MAG: TolC family protein [Deltaproteobacteria bacterium]|nr:TolC family protein [Deltaproteobacteria bacterium]